jgi:hypothetical protein
MQPIQDVVEDLEKRDRADISSFRLTQECTDMFVKLVFGYTDGDSAHGGVLREEFFTNHAALSPFLKV